VVPVHIFCRADRIDDLLGIDPLWQGQLDEDAVDIVIRVQPPYRIKDGIGGRIFRKLDPDRPDPDTLAGLVLHPDIHLGCRIASHDHGCEPWVQAGLLDPLFREFKPFLRTFFSVKDRGHGGSPQDYSG